MAPRRMALMSSGGSKAGEDDCLHYSNSHRQVVWQTPAEFSQHYSAPDNAMFWAAAL